MQGTVLQRKASAARRLESKMSMSTSDIMKRVEACERVHQRTLDVSKLELDSWPAEILKLDNVKILIARKNKFIIMPSLHYYRSLEALDMSRNLITSLEGVKIAFLHDLRRVDFSRNQLTSLPEELCQLPLLEYLNESLPESLSGLTSLKEFDASHNNIVAVQDQFERLVHLTTLNLSHNDKLQVDKMPTRARRLHEKHLLLLSKDERRALVQRALGVRRSVLNREQETILAEIKAADEKGVATEYP